MREESKQKESEKSKPLSKTSHPQMSVLLGLAWATGLHINHYSCYHNFTAGGQEDVPL